MQRAILALIILIAATIGAAAQRPCDRATAFQHAAPTGPLEVVAPVPGQRVYLCGFTLAQKSQALDLQLSLGEGTNCSSNTIAITPQLSLPPDLQLVNRIENVGPSSPLGYGLCLQTFGTGGLTGIIYWAQF